MSCNCNTGFKWDEGYLICIRDCNPSVTPNSNGTNFEFLSCECDVGYQWDYTLVACVGYQNCTGVPNSNGSNENSDACFCNSGYVWNSSWASTNGGACQRNCSLYTKIVGNGTTDPTVCSCANGYYWNNGSTSCVLNCSAADYTNGAVNSTVCKCKSNYRWDTVIGQCVSSKSSGSAVAIACGVAIPLGVLGILAIIGLIWWLCLPTAAPVVAPPPMLSTVAAVPIAPQVLYPTSQVTQVISQPTGSLTRLVPPAGFNPGKF